MEVIIWDGNKPLGKVSIEGESLKTNKGTLREQWFPVFQTYLFNLILSFFPKIKGTNKYS